VTRVAVLGGGSWGTALGALLAGNGHDTGVWCRSADLAARIREDGENRKFLPGIRLPDGVKVRHELEGVLEGAEIVVFAVPSQALREVAGAARAHVGSAVPVSATKGLEQGSLLRMSEVLTAALGDPNPVVLTGPSHAEEVIRGIPTSVVAACRDASRALRAQSLFASPRFRVYTNDDVVGCEIGGALKNVIAVAAGVCDGLGFGDNTKGALLTRGLAEIARLGVAMGGRRETFFGLAGMGDLITTAMSRHSRNRMVGERIGRGETPEAVMASMTMVAEGVHTARVARDLGRSFGLDLPLTEQMCEVIFEGRRPLDAMEALMTRDLRSET